MWFTLYNDVKAFYKDTYDVLMRHEAQNVIPLGNVMIGNEGKDKTGWRDPAHWFMATVSDDTGILLTAIMTPPHALTLYATDNINDKSAVLCLLDNIKNADVSGVMADNALAEMFAQEYALKNGVQYKVEMNQRIYELSQVNPNISKIGSIRLLEEKDLSFFPYWYEGFYMDCFQNPLIINDDIEKYRYYVLKKQLYILEVHGVPVSMAHINREIQTVCVIGDVYTPPYFRGKGYASACVAALSQIVLDKGFSKCVLYTDLANPTSNSIYMKIGYKPVYDSLKIQFSE